MTKVYKQTVMQANKRFYEKKIINCKALDVDSKTRKVKIGISEFETVDYDKDLIDPKAWDRSIAERGPQGSNEIWHLMDHNTTSFSALGKFDELFTSQKHLIGISSYKDSFAWREVAWPLYSSGDFNQHSVGYTTIDSEQKSGYNLLKELKLYEGSAVLFGANPNTPTLEVQKSLGITEKDDIISQLERLTKAIKLDKHEDESHKSLIILEIKRIQLIAFSTFNRNPLNHN